ncbi:MAG: GAF domain-containing protein [Solirubrobacterales bacterium]
MATQPAEAEIGTSEPEALRRAREENETLYAVIKTVSSSLDLDRVLGGIVEIVTAATECHACFIYFLEDDRLVLRAASPHYSRFVARLWLGVDEGLAGWVARTKTPEFIPEDAMSDPRMKYIPELEEERFQSMVAVPILAKGGDVIGVAVLHTAAPREFDDGVLKFLVHTASLVAAAIENAQLYEETRQRVQALTTLTRLSQAIAAVGSRDELHTAVTGGARELLEADSCCAYILDHETDELVLAAADPPDSAPSPGPHPEGTALMLEMMRGSRGRVNGARRCVNAGLLPEPAQGDMVAAPLIAGEEQLGVLCCTGTSGALGAEHAELLGAVANQAAVGLKKAEFIERLTAESLVKDLLDALAAGSVETAELKARDAGCDLGRSHVYLHAEPARSGPSNGGWPNAAAAIEKGVRRAHSGALFDLRHDRIRALVPVDEKRSSADELRRDCERLGLEHVVVFGLSPAERGAASARRRLREALDAARVGRSLRPEGGAVPYQQLGAYRYLVHLGLDDAPRDRHQQSVLELAAYDRRKGTRLVETLEQFLADRGSVTASARALYVHPNTVRQRLDRIERVAGLDLSSEDLLSLELALKLVRLHNRSAG